VFVNAGVLAVLLNIQGRQGTGKEGSGHAENRLETGKAGRTGRRRGRSEQAGKERDGQGIAYTWNNLQAVMKRNKQGKQEIGRESKKQAGKTPVLTSRESRKQLRQEIKYEKQEG